MVINSHNLNNIQTIDEMEVLVSQGKLDPSVLPIARPSTEVSKNDYPIDENGLPDDCKLIDSDSAYFEGGDF